ncbi:topoisomerase DNA-binding C4 zinc finger domain-containing protein [Shewanella surugensis]|uniref:Topoisomerase DNA-binding C4 zinc finger domain-containing protein n=1 Tax=Shewanella surugensis TaxID=212020 RepID=A0ABT0LHP8_9GAMM|nr:topoisomerase DNA-binding C4 zinc finger domain-containing protein [Shewanella surugensis]MCL1126990.1 topoisomerase DNA-binding C4 zinc finger domain-containing protein [Shewanella surugensis]
MAKVDQDLFTPHAKEQEACPLCHGNLMVKNSKHGGFFGCEHYPSCDYTRPLVQSGKIEAQVIAGSQCPKCGGELAVKSGRFGLFIGCTQYPECDHLEKHSQDEKGIAISCPICKQGYLEHKTSRFGKSFYACSAYPGCKFILNYPPVAESCPECDFAILVERKGAAGMRVECPVKSCKYKRLME